MIIIISIHVAWRFRSSACNPPPPFAAPQLRCAQYCVAHVYRPDCAPPVRAYSFRAAVRYACSAAYCGPFPCLQKSSTSVALQLASRSSRWCWPQHNPHCWSSASPHTRRNACVHACGQAERLLREREKTHRRSSHRHHTARFFTRGVGQTVFLRCNTVSKFG